MAHHGVMSEIEASEQGQSEVEALRAEVDELRAAAAAARLDLAEALGQVAELTKDLEAARGQAALPEAPPAGMSAAAWVDVCARREGR